MVIKLLIQVSQHVTPLICGFCVHYSKILPLINHYSQRTFSLWVHLNDRGQLGIKTRFFSRIQVTFVRSRATDENKKAIQPAINILVDFFQHIVHFSTDFLLTFCSHFHQLQYIYNLYC